MFSNFRDTFKIKPQYTIKTPQAVIDALNANLPKGFEYVEKKPGLLALESKGSVNISLSGIRLPHNAKEVLPASPTISDIHTFLYNTQQEAVVEPDQDECITVNGEKMRIKDLIKMPLKDIEVTTKMAIGTGEFAPPFSLELSGAGHQITIMLQRVPYASMTAARFTSCIDSVIKLEYTIDTLTPGSKKDESKITISISVEKAKSVAEVIDAIYIYNSFLDGSITVNGVKMASGPLYPQRNEISKDTVAFWEKTHEIEKLFKVQFVPEPDVSIEVAEKINQLYMCLIEHKPFKVYQTFNSVSGTGRTHKSIKDEETIGKEIHFEFVSSEVCRILKQELNYYGLVGIMGGTVDTLDVPENNAMDEFTIKLVPTEGKRMYSSTLYFSNKENLEEYRRSDHAVEMQNAEELGAIL